MWIRGSSRLGGWGCSSGRGALAKQRPGPTATICWKRSCACPARPPGPGLPGPVTGDFPCLSGRPAGRRGGGGCSLCVAWGPSPHGSAHWPWSSGPAWCWAESGSPCQPAGRPPLVVTPVQVKAGGHGGAGWPWLSWAGARGGRESAEPSPERGGGGRPRLICTLSASDRAASQVRTPRRPPLEGHRGQRVGSQAVWARAGRGPSRRGRRTWGDAARDRRPCRHTSGGCASPTTRTSLGPGATRPHLGTHSTSRGQLHPQEGS